MSGAVSGASVRSAPPGPSSWMRLRSEVLDRVAAVLLGLGLAPVVAALAWWIRRDDGPPTVIGLSRVGRGGRSFRLWKLRTMTVAAPSGRAAGAVLTAGDDRRITRVGRHIRDLHLDELPQLLNVLRGEMALIGSRPESSDLVDLDDPVWAEVLSVAPGITGVTQLVVGEWESNVLSGGGDHVERYRSTVLPVKLAIDRWYLASASPRLDAMIGWSMVERFVLRRRSTAVDRLVRREVAEVAAVDGARAAP